MAVAARALDVSSELWRAAESGDAEALMRLLPYAADVDAPNRHGMTLLMKAACCGHVRMVRLLLEHGADPNRTRNDKFTALSLAAFFGHAETVQTLMDFGARTETTTRCGASARTWATARTFADVARCLETPPPIPQPRAPTQLRRTVSTNRVRALAVCAGFFVIVCGALGALLLRSSEARDLPSKPLAAPATLETIVTNPQPAPPVVSKPADAIKTPAETKTEVRPRPIARRASALPDEANTLPVPREKPAEKIQISETPTVAAPRIVSPKPAALSPQPIAPTKKAKVIQWP